jgi:hypothetical protein
VFGIAVQAPNQIDSEPSSSTPNGLPHHLTSASKLSLHCRILWALEKLTGAFISKSNRLGKSLSICLEPVRISATRHHLKVLLCSTLKCSIQHTSGSELSTHMTRRQRMRNHTWELCGKRSILAFLSRIDKVRYRVLRKKKDGVSFSGATAGAAARWTCGKSVQFRA